MTHRRALVAALTAAGIVLSGYVWMVRRLSMAPNRRWKPADPIPGWDQATTYFHPDPADGLPDAWPDDDATWIWTHGDLPQPAKPELNLLVDERTQEP